MNQNRKNDSDDTTVVFNPITEDDEKTQAIKRVPDSKTFGEVYYYDDKDEDDDEYEEDDDKSGGNGVLIGLVTVLVILFIAAVIWGTAMLNKINKDEEENEPSSEQTEQSVAEEEEEAPESNAVAEKEEKINCYISFKSETVEEEDDGYTVRAIFKDENGKYYTQRLTIDENTSVRADGDRISYKSFVNNVIENLGDSDAEFDGTVDKDSWHVDSISYKSEILEKEEEGIILEDEELPPQESDEEVIFPGGEESIITE